MRWESRPRHAPGLSVPATDRISGGLSPVCTQSALGPQTRLPRGT